MLKNDLHTIKSENVGLQRKTHKKDQQIERCENTIANIRKSYFDHAKNLD